MNVASLAHPDSILSISTVLLISAMRRSREWMGQTLEDEGLRVEMVADVREALDLLRVGYVQGIVLDEEQLSGPIENAVRWLAHRAGRPRVPMLVLLEDDDEQKIVRILERGADAYLIKPFGVEVMTARLARLLRRYSESIYNHRVNSLEGWHPAREQAIRVGPVVILPRQHEVLIDGRAVHLTFTEFRLLLLLASRPGRTFTREDVYAELYDDDNDASIRAIDSQVFMLRRKLGRHAAMLHTVRGSGYRLDPPSA